jgi:CBS domain-containing protein/sporulation protein YlmC with PRC-barrel domain
VPIDNLELVPLSSLVGGPVLDRAGERLGRLDDVIVRLREGGYPPVTGLRLRIGGRRVFLPAEQVDRLGPDRVQLSGETLNLLRFERRPGEVLLKEDVLDRKLINVEAGKLVNANDVALARVGNRWRVMGVDTSPRRLLRRLLPGRPRRLDPRAILDWSGVEPFVGHVPTARLLLPLRRLKRLHPAQIADLVEAASHEQGEEIIEAVHGDPELEADVFEELDPEHQVEFLRTRSDDEAAKVLAEMGPDDAADLITELDQERRASILKLLPPKQQAKVRGLLAYNPGTAGGLMNPDFVEVSPETSIGTALQKVKRADLSMQALTAVFVVDDEHMLRGVVPLPALLRAEPSQHMEEILETPTPPRLRVDADLADVALFMTDYNAHAAPVTDPVGHLVGIITVDDVLEAILPEEWRRRAEAAASD